MMIRRISLLLIIIGASAFALFYQFLISHDERFIINNVIYLSGWDSPVNPSSTLAFHVKEKNNYKFSFKISLKNNNQVIDIYLNNKKLKALNLENTNGWLKMELRLPKDFIKGGYNSLAFFNASKDPSAAEYKDIAISLFSAPVVNILISAAILTIGLFIFWLIYSMWFARISGMDYSKALSVDSISYISGVFICIVVVIIGKALHQNRILAEINFVFLTLLLTCFFKLFAFFKYTGLSHKGINYFSLGAAFVLFSACSLVMGRDKFNLQWLVNLMYFLFLYLCAIKLVRIKAGT